MVYSQLVIKDTRVRHFDSLCTSSLVCCVGFKYELALCLNGTIGIPDLQKEEKTIFTEFRVANQSKTHFNYLLLDPLKLKSLSDESVSNISFKHFIESLFYVGKGKNSRSMQHLKDAKKLKTGTAVSVSDIMKLLLFCSLVK